MSNQIKMTLPGFQNITARVKEGSFLDYDNEQVKLNKVLALASNNTENIISSFGESKDKGWYSELNKLRCIIKPVKSNLVNTITDTIVNIMYNKEISNEVFSFEDLKRIEKELQLRGEIHLRIFKLNDKWVIEQIQEDNVKVKYDRYKNILGHRIEEEFTENDKLYVLQQFYNKLNNQQINKVFEKSGNDLIEIEDIKSLDFTSELEKELYNEYYHIHTLTTNNRIKETTDLIEVVDKSLSIKNHLLLHNIPIKMIPVDSALLADASNGISGEASLEGFDINQYTMTLLNGVIKVPFEENAYQQPETLQSNISAQLFEDVELSMKKTILNIIGLSPTTFGLDLTSANSSGSSIVEKEKSTMTTRDSLVLERASQLNSILAELGIEGKIVFPNYLSQLDSPTLLSLSDDVANGRLTLRTYLELKFTNWSSERIEEELRNIDIASGLNDGLSYS